MKQQILLRAALPVALMALAACSQDAPVPDETHAAAQDPAAADDAVLQPESTPSENADSGTETLAKTMPTAMFGRWHTDDLGRAPTTADCDPELDATRDYDRLITVYQVGYGYFETGGRIIDVHARTDSMIDATFDTTYADTPTQARKDFALQANGTLAVNHDDGDGQAEVTQYRRCPE